MRTLMAAVLIGVLCRTLPASAAPEYQTLLQRAFRNPRSVAHTGTMKVSVPGQLGPPTSVRVICDGHGRERREHLDGAARGLVVLTDGRNTWQHSAGEARWSLLPPGADPGASWERLCRNYQIKEEGVSRIAGRPARSVSITPRHPGNPRQVVWLDTATALVLRADSYAYDGRLTVRTLYTALSFGRVPAIALPAPGNVIAPTGPGLWSECSSRAEMERQVGFSVALPQRLPSGYEAVAFYSHGCNQGGLLPVVRFSDGRSALTLFVTCGPGGGPGYGRGRGAGMGRGMGRGRGWRGGRGAGPGACQLEQVSGQQVARVVYGSRIYLLVGDHEPSELAAALQSLR